MRVIMPGSYDPVTSGHLEIIKRVASIEDEVYVVVFNNPSKEYLFSVSDRVAMLMLATEGLDNVLVSYSDGRVVDYMREHNVSRIVKGYRNEEDLSWEHKQAEYNMAHGGYETELIKCGSEFEGVSSTLARQRLLSGESLEGILPSPVIDYIRNLNRKDFQNEREN